MNGGFLGGKIIKEGGNRKNGKKQQDLTIQGHWMSGKLGGYPEAKAAVAHIFNEMKDAGKIGKRA